MFRLQKVRRCLPRLIYRRKGRIWCNEKECRCQSCSSHRHKKLDCCLSGEAHGVHSPLFYKFETELPGVLRRTCLFHLSRVLPKWAAKCTPPCSSHRDSCRRASSLLHLNDTAHSSFARLPIEVILAARFLFCLDPFANFTIIHTLDEQEAKRERD